MFDILRQGEPDLQDRDRRMQQMMETARQQVRPKQSLVSDLPTDPLALGSTANVYDRILNSL